MRESFIPLNADNAVTMTCQVMEMGQGTGGQTGRQGSFLKMRKAGAARAKQETIGA